ncbi:helix-turn-helix domain-containing protein [Reyranella sp. CPCC 100927]|uniref:AraC family transcriptional regulator n=1 Tax=Reyranella sp. CPCC 100927 TaxID=2599616 RepID=UPI0015B50E67|nr:AraC family transcriptional regulator [Reyranella sp. CPCC 100927]
MQAPVDRSPLHRHPELYCSDAAGAADLLARKGFNLTLPHHRDGEGGMRVNAVDLPSIHLCYVRYGTEAIATTNPARTDYRVQFPLAGRSVSVMGRTEVLCADMQGVVGSPLCDQVIRSAADSQRLMMYFAGDALIRHLNAMMGEAIVEKVRFDPVLNLASGAGRSLRRWVMLAVEELDDSNALLANPLAATQFEQLVLTGLVCGQPHNYSALLHRRTAISPRSVRRALDYIHANLHRPITAEQLAAAAAVPGRTLYAHFRLATGLAPLAYVRKARYEQVRRELLAGPDDHLTIVAARWGFEHMGRFAAGYRALFGERPSQTLRRR